MGKLLQLLRQHKGDTAGCTGTTAAMPGKSGAKRAAHDKQQQQQQRQRKRQKHGGRDANAANRRAAADDDGEDDVPLEAAPRK